MIVLIEGFEDFTLDGLARSAKIFLSFRLSRTRLADDGVAWSPTEGASAQAPTRSFGRYCIDFPLHPLDK